MKKFFILFVLLFAFSLPVLAYTDVSSSHDFEEAIDYLTDINAIEGYSDGTYQPAKTINRAEFTKILVFAKLGEEPVEDAADCFDDVDKNIWYASYVCHAKNEGIIDGYPDGSFGPANAINLAEASKILVNTLEVDTAEPKGSAWYSEYMEALSSRAYLPNSFHYFSEEVNRGEMAEMMWRIMEDKRSEPAVTVAELEETPCQELGLDVPASIDMDRVRSTWLGWYNGARAAEGLYAYTYNSQLERSAITWSELAEDRGYLDHKRVGQTEYYDYWMIVDWFKDQGLEFENVNRVTFTENIGWGPYSCDEADCTDELIEKIRASFDFYMAEKYDDYRPHYNSLMNAYFKEIGLGIAIDEGAGKYYLTVHYGTKITSNPLPICL